MVIGVMGAGARFRVVLNAEHGESPVLKSRNGAVVEIEMSDFDRFRIQGIGIQGKTMVLTGDLHLTCGSTGVVQTAMAIGELEGPSPQCQTENLVAEAYAEER